MAVSDRSVTLAWSSTTWRKGVQLICRDPGSDGGVPPGGTAVALDAAARNIGLLHIAGKGRRPAHGWILKGPSKSSVSAQRSTFRISFRPAVCGGRREKPDLSRLFSAFCYSFTLRVSGGCRCFHDRFRLVFPPAALAPQAVRPRHKEMTMGRSTDAENLDDRFFFIKPFPSKIHRPFC